MFNLSNLKELLPYKYVAGHNSNKKPLENSNLYPVIRNQNGDEMRIYYLQDKLCAHTPYSLVAGRFPKHILWDRYNKGLDIHFYTHGEMKHASEYAKKKYGIFRESEQIAKEDYEWALNHSTEIGQFDKVFTHSARLLDKYSNAAFAPANGIWYGTFLNGGTAAADNYLSKERNISMVCSDKVMCDLHKWRIDVARHFVSSGKVDVYGKACGDYLRYKADALTGYRYSIAMENDITPFYFTEKILDCFASMTIPIYVGASDIDRFFDPGGIIHMNDIYDLAEWDRIIDKCCKEDYEERLDAVKNNYETVMKKFVCIEDYISDHYSL